MAKPEETTAPATATPPPATPAATPAAAAVVVPPAVPDQPAGGGEPNPAWLKSRLEREQRTMLKSLGVESVEDISAALADLKKRRDSEKTERQVLDEAMAQLKAQVKRIPALESALNAQTDAEMAKLTDGQRAAVLNIAPVDKAQQLSCINALRPTWTVLAGIGAETAKPNLATVPAAATTVPTALAPAPAQPGQPIDWLALYKSHKSAGRDTFAARILVDHQEIAPHIHKAQ
jgi:hypothetical protein